MKIIDLTQTLINRMQVYPGDEPPMLYQTHLLDFDGHTNFHLTLGMHTGTHIDGPWHKVGNKQLISDIPLNRFIGKGCVIDIRGSKVFDDSNLVKQKAAGNEVVLFYTGFGAHFGTPQYLKDYPLISENVAKTLVEMNIKMLGIDTLSPDDFPHSVHKILLGKEILVSENLTNLDQLLEVENFTVIALPLKIVTDSAPARILATIEN